MSNRRQRMVTSASATRAIRVMQTHVSEFTKVIGEHDFPEKAVEAAKNPNARESRELWARVSRCIRTTGAHVAYSPEQRSSALNEIYGLTVAFGTPSLFVTVSPDEVNSGVVLSIHRFLRKMSPSTMAKYLDDPDVLQRIGNDGISENVTKFTHELTKEEYTRLFHTRSANAAKTAGLAGPIFHEVVDAFFRIMVGVPRGATELNLVKNPKRATLGIFGRMTAYHGVVECQGKGTLHVHALLWGGLSPELLSAAVDDPELRREAARVMNSIVSARLSQHVHRVFPTPAERFAPGCTCERRILIPDFPVCFTETCHRLQCLCAKPDLETAAADPLAATTDGAAAAAAGPPPPPRPPPHPPFDADAARALIAKLTAARGRGGVTLEMTDELCIDLLLWCPCEAHKNLRSIIGSNQKHCCTTTCFKNGCLCRMGFPTSAPTEAGVLELLRALATNDDGGNGAFDVRQLGRVVQRADRRLRAAGAVALPVLPVPVPAPPPAAAVPLAAAAAPAAAPAGKAPARRPGKTTKDGAFVDVVPVPVGEVETRYPDAETLAQMRQPEVKSAGVDPLKSLGIKKDKRVLLWTLARGAEDFDICPYSLAMLAVFGCNCAIVPLGTAESAIAAAFYMANYMCKYGLKLEHGLPVVVDAIHHAAKYPSTADDAQTQQRKDNFVLQVSLNKIHRLSEIPVSMASSIGIGRTAHESSHSFCWVYVNQARRVVEQLHGAPPTSTELVRLRAEHRAKKQKARSSGTPLPEPFETEVDALRRGRLFRDIDDCFSDYSDEDGLSDLDEIARENGESLCRADTDSEEEGSSSSSNNGSVADDDDGAVDGAVASRGPSARLVTPSVTFSNAPAQQHHGSISLDVAATEASSRGSLSSFDLGPMPTSRALRFGADDGDDDDWEDRAATRRNDDDDDDDAGQDDAPLSGGVVPSIAAVDEPSGIVNDDGRADPLLLAADPQGQLHAINVTSAYAHRTACGAERNLLMSSGCDRYLPSDPAQRKFYLDISMDQSLYEWSALVNPRHSLLADSRKRVLVGSRGIKLTPTKKKKEQQQQKKKKKQQQPLLASKRTLRLSPSKKKKRSPTVDADDDGVIVISDTDDDDNNFVPTPPSEEDEDAAEAAAAAEDPDDDDEDAPPKNPMTLHYNRAYNGSNAHGMRVRGNFVIPRLAGRVLGRATSRNSVKQLDDVARYIGVLFCPWDISRPPCVRNWDTFVDWYVRLDTRCERQAGIKACVRTMLTYNSNRYTKTMINSYRMRHAASKYKRDLVFSAEGAEISPYAIAETAEQQISNEDILAARQGARRRVAPNIDLDVLAYSNYIRRHDTHGVELKATLVEPTPEQMDQAAAAIANMDPAMPRRRFYEDGELFRNAAQADLEFEAVYRMRNMDDETAAAGGADDDAYLPRDRLDAERLRAAQQAADAAKERQQQMRDEKLAQRVRLLTPEQLATYNSFTAWVAKREALKRQIDAAAAGQAAAAAVAIAAGGAGTDRSAETLLPPGACFQIDGQPGAGKSFLIEALSMFVETLPGGEALRPLLMAYTGFAASHIGGITIHRALMLYSKKLHREQRSKLRRRINAAAYLLIDEKSMIGAEKFCEIIERIEDILEDPDNNVRPKFGQKGFPCIVLVGDFAQLPPIQDIPLFTPLDSLFAKLATKDDHTAAQKDVQAIRARLGAGAAAALGLPKLPAGRAAAGAAPARPARPVVAAAAAAAAAPGAAADAAAAAAAALVPAAPAPRQPPKIKAPVALPAKQQAPVPPAQAKQQGKGKAGAAAKEPAPPLAAAALTNARAACKLAKQARGLLYFTFFEAVKLACQVRANAADPQAQLVSKMASEGRIPDLTTGAFAIEQLNELSSSADVKAFRYAPVATCLNRRRRAINFAQAQSFAAEHGLPVVVWRKRVPANSVTDEVLEGFAELGSAYYSVFVPGAPAMVLVNVVPHLSISNGTGAVMHSLTWLDAAVGDQNRRRMLAAGPGQIVEVEMPDYVNVVIKSRHELPLRTLSQQHPLFDVDASRKGLQHFVFPMRIWNVRAVPHKNKKYAMPAHQSHQLELGFAFTYYKLQGATLPKLVLDLNFYPSSMCTFSAVYVGLTRVKAMRDLRLLPVRMADMSLKLRQLAFCADLRRWNNREEGR